MSYTRKEDTKQMTVTLPYELVQRVSFLRKIGAGESINSSVCDFLSAQVELLEKKMRIPPGSWSHHLVCEKCGSIMVKRTPKAPDGKVFWGCVKYPQCNHTSPMASSKKQ